MKLLILSFVKKSNVLFCTISFLFCLLVNAQKENRIDDEFPTPVAFPYEFFGNYAGNLNISDSTGSLVNAPTEFTISRTDDEEVFSYEFSFIQGSERIVNKYLLHIINEEQGYYAITDDKGLEFMATLIKGVLYSTHDTKDTMMFTSIQFMNDGRLRFNVMVSKKSKAKGKGGTNLSNVIQVQKALLSKI